MTTAYHCGRYIELYTNRLSKSPKKAPQGDFIEHIQDYNKQLYTYQSYHRAKQNVKRLMFCNLTGQNNRDIFFTLTYTDNMQDYQQSQLDFNRFRSRCRKAGFDFPYLVISEKQKRGAIHHHGVFFNTGRIDIHLLSSLWTHGFVWLNSVDYKKPPTALANYITKYITKTQDKSKHTKYYRTSYSIIRPVKYTGNIYIPRIHIPHKILYKSEYTPLYSEPVEYSLLQVEEGLPWASPSILEALHLAT
jgi:hypothetical protein